MLGTEGWGLAVVDFSRAPPITLGFLFFSLD